MLEYQRLKAMNSYCCGSNKKLICLILFMIGYLSVGAIVFIVLEGENEDIIRDDLKEKINEFYLENLCVECKFIIQFLRFKT